ncbi:RNA-directed DNA polymerase, eukaryota [Tanacetum coccineum]
MYGRFSQYSYRRVTLADQTTYDAKVIGFDKDKDVAILQIDAPTKKLRPIPVGSVNHMSYEGFDDVGLRYVGGRWVWLEFNSMDQVESVKTSKALKEIFLEFKDVSHDFIPDERCVWI